MFADWTEGGGTATVGLHHQSWLHASLSDPLPFGDTYCRTVGSGQPTTYNRWTRFHSILAPLVNIPNTKAISARCWGRGIRRASATTNYSFGAVAIHALGSGSNADTGYIAGVGNGAGVQLDPSTGVFSQLAGGADPALPHQFYPGITDDAHWHGVRVDRIPTGPGDWIRTYHADPGDPTNWILLRDAFIPIGTLAWLGWPCPRVGFLVGTGYWNTASRGFIDNVLITTEDV